MPEPGQNIKANALKFIALLSIVRWYNIILLVIAQYLAAIFLMNDRVAWHAVLLDLNLHKIIIATVLIVSAGFIINNFYDHEKDLINRPLQTSFEKLLRKRTKLNFYFGFNIFGSLFALFISWRALLFFSAYAFFLWLYSHKFKKVTLLGNLVASGLSIAPFFGIFFYYPITEYYIFPLVGIFWSLNFFREIIKDMMGVKGDTLSGYPTLPVVKGIENAKKYTVLISLPSAFFTYLVWPHAEKPLHIFLVIQLMVLILSIALLQWAKNQKTLQIINTICKVLVICGVFSIPLFH